MAGSFVKGGGFGLIGDIVVSIIGAFIGAWLAGAQEIGDGSGLIASLITTTVGALLLLVIVGGVRREEAHMPTRL